eukprot:COSAG02_NODE_64688_length_260_cov_0.503106_1_plen_79_part_10
MARRRRTKEDDVWATGTAAGTAGGTTGGTIVNIVKTIRSSGLVTDSSGKGASEEPMPSEIGISTLSVRDTPTGAGAPPW